MAAAALPAADPRPGSAPWLSRDDARGWTLLSPVVLFLLVAMAAPLALLLAYSFWTQDGLTVDTSFTLDRYADVLTREAYQTLFLRTVAISGAVTVLTIAMAYPVAYYVAFHVTRNKFLWLLALTIPFWISYLLRVFAWRLILGFNGVINSGLISAGLISEPLEFLLFNPFAVVLTLAHAWAAFAILPLYVSLEKIDRRLLEAAADLGDGPLTRFLRVTLPLSAPGVIAAAVMIFVPTTGDYVTPALVGGTDGIMIANLIQVQFTRTNNWPLGAAIAVSAMAMIALIVTFLLLAARAAQRSAR